MEEFLRGRDDLDIHQALRAMSQSYSSNFTSLLIEGTPSVKVPPTFRLNSPNFSEFRQHWSTGTPIVVTRVKLHGIWDPAYFIKDHGSTKVTVINCKNQEAKRISLLEFFSTFGEPLKQGEVWKLKVHSRHSYKHIYLRTILPL